MTPISGREVGEWVRGYDDAGIDRGAPPPEEVRQLASSCACVLTSDLRRSIESAAWLCPSHPARPEADLREAVLPDSLPVPLRFSPSAWVVIARIGWWFNWCRSPETPQATRRRAARVAGRLCDLSALHGSVLVVGHGMFNRLVARELRRRGWRGPRLLPRGFWGAARFERDAPPA